MDASQFARRRHSARARVISFSVKAISYMAHDTLAKTSKSNGRTGEGEWSLSVVPHAHIYPELVKLESYF